MVGRISASGGVEGERERRLSLVATMDPRCTSAMHVIYNNAWISFPFLLVSRKYRSRPHTILSKDGSKLLNLWYIPPFSEVIEAISKLDPNFKVLYRRLGFNCETLITHNYAIIICLQNPETQCFYCAIKTQPTVSCVVCMRLCVCVCVCV